MLGLIVFDSLNDVIYVHCDDSFAKHINALGLSGGYVIDDQNTNEEIVNKSEEKLDRNVVLQIFSPLVTSQRVMFDQFKNGYQYVSCEDDTTLMFHQKGQYLLLAIGRKPHSLLQRYIKVASQIVHLTVGPCLSVLKSNLIKTRQLDNCLSAWLDLYYKQQSYLVEAIERIIVEPDLTTTCLQALQAASKELTYCKDFLPGHSLLFSQSKLLAFYSNKEAGELSGADILYVNLLVESYFYKGKTKTRLTFPSMLHSDEGHVDSHTKEFNTFEIFLNSSNGHVRPFTMYFHQVTSELNLVLLVEPAWNYFSSILTTILTTLESATENRKVSIEMLESQLKIAEDNLSVLPDNLNERTKSFMVQANRRWESIKHNGTNINGELSGKSDSFLGSLSDSITNCWQACSLEYHQDHWNSYVTSSIRKFHEKISGNPTLLQPKALLDLSSGRGPYYNIKKYMEEFAGLVHFLYVDRFNNQLTAPILSNNSDSTNAVTQHSLWSMVEFSHEHLSTGHQCLLWKDKTFTYSYFLWFEDFRGNPIKSEEDFDKVVMEGLQMPGVLADNFYKKLSASLFPSIDPSTVRVYELYCIHIGLATSPVVLEQTRRLAATVWEIAGPSLPNPIDLL